MNLGERLREARRLKGWSLRALGERTGFSASFLSQVELGQSSPSLASLEKIATALGLSLGSVIAGEPGASVLLRRADRDGLRSDWSRAYVESLLPGGWDDHLEALLLRLDPDGRTGARPIAPGTKLFSYVTSGRAQVLLSDPTEEFSVEQGDSIVLEGPRAISWENRDAALAEVVVLAARFR